MGEENETNISNSMVKSPSWEANTHTVNKLPAFCGTQRFVTMLTGACQWSTSWARWIQSHSYTLFP